MDYVSLSRLEITTYKTKNVLFKKVERKNRREPLNRGMKSYSW